MYNVRVEAVGGMSTKVDLTMQQDQIIVEVVGGMSTKVDFLFF